MSNIHLTDQMQEYVQRQIQSGGYSNLAEVVHAGLCALMKRDGVRQLYVLKADFERAATQAEAGAFDIFDAEAFEPDAFTEIAEQLSFSRKRRSFLKASCSDY